MFYLLSNLQKKYTTLKSTHLFKLTSRQFNYPRKYTHANTHTNYKHQSHERVQQSLLRNLVKVMSLWRQSEVTMTTQYGYHDDTVAASLRHSDVTMTTP